MLRSLSAMVLLGLINSTLITAQPQVSKWAFGASSFYGSCGLDFMTNAPSIFTTSINGAEGCSSVADDTGNLLFYTQGTTIWNKSHAVMANGTGLLGDISTTQSSLIVKKPGSQNLFYVFTLDAHGGTDGLNYSIVDMSLAAGMGSVTVKNMALYNVSQTEKLAGVRHCNGIDVWVVVHEFNSSSFRSYLLTSSGINSTPIISSVGATINGSNPFNGYGYLKASPSGKKLILCSETVGLNTELFDFDNSTGTVSSPVLLTTTGAYGCEFSPDGSKVYAIKNHKIYQWNLCAGSTQAIQNSKTLVDSTASIYESMGAMQLAPDGKIYITRPGQSGQNYLNIIHSPNSSASTCNFQDKAIFYGFKSVVVGLPNFVAGDIRSPFVFTQDLSCPTVSFTAPSTAIASLAPCSSVGKSPTAISWNFGDPGSGANNASSSTMPVHTYPSAGTYTVRMVVSYSNCAPDTLYKFVTITTPTLGITTVSATCSGLGAASVTVEGVNGPFNYLWSPGGQNTAQANNLTPGLYTVSISRPGGSCPASQTVNVSTPIHINSSIQSGSLSCTSASAQAVINNGSGNYTYTWTPGGQNTSSVTGLGSGVYTFAYSDTTNKCTGSSTILVQLPVPTLSVNGNFTICPKVTATLTASGADTYSWSNGPATASTTASPTTNTTYTVVGTYTGNTCTASKTVAVIASKCVGLEEAVLAEKVKLFPNPFSGTIRVEGIIEGSVTIIDVLGKTVGTSIIKDDREVDLSGLENGIYFMRIQQREISITKQIIKQ